MHTTAMRRGIVFALVAFVAASTLVVLRAPHAIAAGDVELAGSTTYQVDLDESEVDVEVEYAVRNVKPNTRRGSIITQYYYDRVFFFVPRDAQDIAVASQGRALDFTELWEDGTRYLEIDLPSRLFYRQSRVVDVTFSLDGSKLRQGEPVRVNPAHVTMWAWAWGDPGRASVRIEIPRGFELDWFGSEGAVDDLQRDFSSPDVDVWYVDDIEGPDEWWVSAVGDRPSALAIAELDIEGIEIEIRSWPGEETWYADVTETLETGLGALVDAVGLEWPVDEPLVVSQSSVPNRAGYGGWYFTDIDEIEIGEDVDELLVLHEVSHAWFNDELFIERWIGEGLAEAIPAHVLRETFDLTEFPTVVNESSSAAVRLNVWADPSFDPNQDDEEVERELWAYNASYWVIHRLIDEIGVDGLASVLVAADADEIAYRGSVPVERANEGPDDWRRFLDLLEEVGGSETATDLFVDLVVTTFSEDALDERMEARTAYRELIAESGWAMPIYVRQSMEAWEFADAHQALDELSVFVTERDAHEVESRRHGFVPPDFQRRYETVERSSDIEAMQTRIDARRTAISAWEAAAEAYDADRDLATTIGLNELPDPGLTLLDAHRALNDHQPDRSIELSRRVHFELAYAAAVGQERVDDVVTGLLGLLALLGVALVWAGVKLRRRRESRRQGPEPREDPVLGLPGSVIGDVPDSEVADAGHMIGVAPGDTTPVPGESQPDYVPREEP